VISEALEFTTEIDEMVDMMFNENDI
jgi:hypothetical protein